MSQSERGTSVPTVQILNTKILLPEIEHLLEEPNAMFAGPNRSVHLLNLHNMSLILLLINGVHLNLKSKCGGLLTQFPWYIILLPTNGTKSFFLVVVFSQFLNISFNVTKATTSATQVLPLLSDPLVTPSDVTYATKASKVSSFWQFKSGGFGKKHLQPYDASEKAIFESLMLMV